MKVHSIRMMRVNVLPEQNFCTWRNFQKTESKKKGLFLFLRGKIGDNSESILSTLVNNFTFPSHRCQHEEQETKQFMIIRVRTRRQLSVVIDKRFAVFINQTLFLYQMEKLYVFPFPPFCKGGRKIQFVGLSISCHIGHWRINADAPVAASSMGPRILIGCLCCLAPYIQLISLEKSVGITSQFPKLY